MNDVQIFKNPVFGEIRVTGSADKPMFCLTDVCKALDIKNVSDCKSRLNQHGVGTTDTIDALGRKQPTTFINEGNLYKCIFQSRKAEANQFQDWVTDEVLPSIRKTGGYMVAKKEDTPETIMARAILVAQDTLTRQKQQIASLQADVKKLTPAAEYTQQILLAKNTWNTNVVAKEFGMSAKTLNKHLQRLGIQYKQHGVWLLAHRYQDKGYTKTHSYDYINSHGEACSRMQTEWTETGRKWLHELHDKKWF